MEKFYLEEPCIKRKKEAIEFINEFYTYNSKINGTGGLQRFLDNYEGWLEKLEKDYKRKLQLKILDIVNIFKHSL